MSFVHLADSENIQFKDNQGFINAKTVRLYYADKTALKVFAKTLSEVQREQAREHLKTVLKLRKQK